MERQFILKEPVILLALVAGVSLAGCNQEVPQELEDLPPLDNEALIEKLSNEIPDLMARAEIPGLSIAVVRDGEIVWAEGFGVTDTSNPAPVSAGTVFEAASLSKPVFSLAYLQMLDEEGLDLDRPIADFFSYDRFSEKEHSKKITPRMILSHRTGLPNWDREGDLDFDREPGTRYGYSGEGFVYLQRYVEDHTGRSLHDFVTERVFLPLGMTRSGFVWQDGFEASFAEGHDGGGKTRASSRYPEANAAYSLLTTSIDYARFMASVMAGDGLKGETFTQVLEPQTRMIGNETRTKHPKEIWGKIAWGLSWGIQENSGQKIFWHWGDNDTYRNFAAFDLDRNIGFVYFTNSENGLAIANDIAKPIVGDMKWTVTWLGYRALPRDPKS